VILESLENIKYSFTNELDQHKDLVLNADFPSDFMKKYNLTYADIYVGLDENKEVVGIEVYDSESGESIYDVFSDELQSKIIEIARQNYK
jgi:hypothetical protein